MAVTAEIQYLGNLRTKSVHLRSGNEIITDAPVDNNGKGEAFSPTDLVASALVSCMFTIMGIAAEKRGWDLGELSGIVRKIMGENPRRIIRLEVEMYFRRSDIDEKQKMVLEHAAKSCPVAMSLHPELEVTVNFLYEK
ncbi:MAG: OsmC family protein [Bacteroidia bacterium]|nr:OsmC family protein [Bacteroidia bacterium]